jgi:hypothetical protein
VGLIVEALTRAVCDRRGHRWREYMLQGQPDSFMRWALRRYCTRCEANRLVFLDSKGGLPTGEELVCTAAEVSRLAPAWLEGLYRARWGDYPRRRVTVGGAFPEEWRWAE